jgi:hypothetical protein
MTKMIWIVATALQLFLAATMTLAQNAPSPGRVPTPMPAPAPGAAPPLPPPAQPYQIKTEWVWLASTFDKEMEELARAITEKYRAQLDIPVGVSINVDEWLAQGQPLTVSGPRQVLAGLSATVDLNSEQPGCVGAARAEFSARKKRLEDAALASFKNWTTAVAVKSPGAASALWQAVMDLRHYKQTWTQQAAGTLRWKEQLALAMGKHAGDFVQEGGLNFEKWLGRKLNLGKRVDPMSVYPFEWIAAWHASNLAEAYFTSLPQAVLGLTAPAQLDPLIENFTKLGDGMLDEIAYPRPIGPMQPGYDPRNLGAAEGFYTGFAIKFNYEGVLNRKFNFPKTVCIVGERRQRHGVECTLSPDDMRNLAQGGKKEVYEQLAINVGTRHQVDASNIEGYYELATRFKQYEKDLKMAGEQGERLWFERLNSPNPVVAASAMRLLMKDLRHILEDEWVPGAVKQFAMDQLIERIGDVLPPWAKPFRASLRTFIEGAVNAWAPDRLARLIDQLDRDSIKVVLTKVPPSNVVKQFPNGQNDLRALLKVDPAQMPPSCQQDVEVPNLSALLLDGKANLRAMKAKLESDGLKVGVPFASAKTPSEKRLEYQFASQSHAAKTRVPRGTPITVSIYQKFEETAPTVAGAAVWKLTNTVVNPDNNPADYKRDAVTGKYSYTANRFNWKGSDTAWNREWEFTVQWDPPPAELRGGQTYTLKVNTTANYSKNPTSVFLGGNYWFSEEMEPRNSARSIITLGRFNPPNQPDGRACSGQAGNCGKQWVSAGTAEFDIAMPKDGPQKFTFYQGAPLYGTVSAFTYEKVK